MKANLKFSLSIDLLIILLLLGSASLHQVAEGSNLTIAEVNSNTFVSQWNTGLTSTGSSTSQQVKLPLESSGTYDFTVDCGDGVNNTITSWNQAEVTHTNTSEGVYTI